MSWISCTILAILNTINCVRDSCLQLSSLAKHIEQGLAIQCWCKYPRRGRISQSWVPCTPTWRFCLWILQRGYGRWDDHKWIHVKDWEPWLVLTQFSCLPATQPHNLPQVKHAYFLLSFSISLLSGFSVTLLALNHQLWPTPMCDSCHQCVKQNSLLFVQTAHISQIIPFYIKSACIFFYRGIVITHTTIDTPGKTTIPCFSKYIKHYLLWMPYMLRYAMAMTGVCSSLPPHFLTVKMCLKSTSSKLFVVSNDIPHACCMWCAGSTGGGWNWELL